MAKKDKPEDSMWFGGDRALVVFRLDANAVGNVRILEKTFNIDTRDLGVLKVPQEKVKTVIYKNPPLYPDDMIRTYTGTELNGVILNDPIRMDAEEIGGKISIPKSKILSIIW